MSPRPVWAHGGVITTVSTLLKHCISKGSGFNIITSLTWTCGQARLDNWKIQMQPFIDEILIKISDQKEKQFWGIR